MSKLDNKQILDYITKKIKENNSYEYYEGTTGGSKINGKTGHYYGYEVSLKNNISAILVKSMSWGERIDYSNFVEDCKEEEITFSLQLNQKTVVRKSFQVYLSKITREEFEYFETLIDKDDYFFKIQKEQIEISKDEEEAIVEDLINKTKSMIRKDKIKNILED